MYFPINAQCKSFRRCPSGGAPPVSPYKTSLITLISYPLRVYKKTDSEIVRITALEFNLTTLVNHKIEI